LPNKFLLIVKLKFFWFVKRLFTADCLRVGKSTMAYGLEARVLFFFKALLKIL